MIQLHYSVLLKETINCLNLKEDSVVVDCTLGYAGHSSLILEKIPKGFLYAFDQDKEAVLYSQEKLSKIANNFEIISSNFENLQEELKKRGVKKVDAILFDLGVSSPQLDEDYRGFSYHKDAFLDMRMDQSNPLNAYIVVNDYPKQKLIDIFKRYGEEKYAVKIACSIEQNRKIKPIETTLQLADIIKESVPMKYRKKKHPARKVFQAIRIEVNRELEVFEKALMQSLDIISKKGRVCVITFHSLEDRICKQIFKSVSEVDYNLKNMPVIPDNLLPNFRVMKSVIPSERELVENNRSRSAKLRVIERVK